MPAHVGYAAPVLISAGRTGSLGGASERVRPFWTLVHVAGDRNRRSWWGRPATAWFESAGTRGTARRHAAGALRRRLRPAPGGAAGLLWVALPCGLLQSALLVSALGSGPFAGAAIMGSFGLASAIGLWIGPPVWATLRATSRPWLTASLSVRLAGLLLAGASLFAAWHGLGEALCAVPF